MLSIKNVTKKFGGVVALSSVNIKLGDQPIYGLIGPNGSGKSTLFNICCGLYHPDEGEIYLGDERITGLKPHLIALRGLARVFQTPRLFRNWTVLQNLLAPTLVLKIENAREHAEKLLDRVGLLDKKDERATALSVGQQRILEICRALMPNPKIVLLDEAFVGLHPNMVRKIAEIIKDFSKECKFWIISHNISAIMELCNYIYVLSYGIKIAEGPPSKIVSDKKVIEAYLGESPQS